MHSTLPIDPILPELMSALKSKGQAVLQAPPGAGKTTRVPLAMLEAGITQDRILILEPRRLAARAAAARLAENLGQTVGQTVGYRIKGESKIGKTSRIEVITEGILTRMIQSDPELSGIGAIIFDEFHERSLQADLGLALTLEIRDALREDMVLLVMSATLDAQPVATLMGGAPVITSAGRSYDVDTVWLAQPWAKPRARGPRFEDALADLVLAAEAETTGDILVFAPGEGEIKRVQSRLKAKLPSAVTVFPLYGALKFSEQKAALTPLTSGRKIVLATSIAETSLTIDGVRVVVDGGRARRAQFDPASGMSRLVTERVTKAEATQRRGRAGRQAAGTCYRLWTKGEEGGMRAFPHPEIQTADLSSLVLELALWGVRDPDTMAFLTPPNPRAFQEAQSLLTTLGALTTTAQITAHGRQMASLPLHPRLAHLVLTGGTNAAVMAALLAERDPINRMPIRAPIDLSLRIAAVLDPKKFQTEHPYAVNQGAIARIRSEARRFKSKGTKSQSIGAMVALAYPDRVGQRRVGTDARFILSGGKGAHIDASDPMSGNRYIVAADLDGDRKEALVRLAAEISDAEIRDIFADQITTRETCVWSTRERAVRPRRQDVFGALILDDQNWQDCPPDLVANALCVGIKELGISALKFSKPANLWIARVEFLRKRGADFPDCSGIGLMDGLDDWLLPFLSGLRTAKDVSKLDMMPALAGRLSWDQTTALGQMAPASITAPTGTRLPVDYSADIPSVSVRLQELFGLTQHPCVGPDQLPLQIELLSPARRPVQLTSDLPGFWRSSYADVRKDMRGRYPKHPWPEDPTKAEATRRVKPRKP